MLSILFNSRRTVLLGVMICDDPSQVASEYSFLMKRIKLEMAVTIPISNRYSSLPLSFLSS